MGGTDFTKSKEVDRLKNWIEMAMAVAAEQGGEIKLIIHLAPPVPHIFKGTRPQHQNKGQIQDEPRWHKAQTS